MYASGRRDSQALPKLRTYVWNCAGLEWRTFPEQLGELVGNPGGGIDGSGTLGSSYRLGKGFRGCFGNLFKMASKRDRGFDRLVSVFLTYFFLFFPTVAPTPAKSCFETLVATIFTSKPDLLSKMYTASASVCLVQVRSQMTRNKFCMLSQVVVMSRVIRCRIKQGIPDLPPKQCQGAT